VDNTPLSQIMIPQLSTIGYPIGGAAHAAVGGIIAAVSGKPADASDRALPMRVIYRETT
ncbi:substrate-binding domain-containing protein, partial [Arthrobacter sp. ZBG10]|uniref:substrate-binding domain-containing protein n=1 Tax=Arthrobacter sp. ZBG10 TaxID=1676590 RepID=UPI000A4E7698